MTDPKTTSSRPALRLGHAIRQARKDKQLSLSKLSAITKIDKGTLSRIENGKAEPPLPRLRAIARALGVDSSSLLAA